MPGNVVHAYHGSKEKPQESMHPYQSVWMAHWGQRRCDSAASASGAHSHFSVNDSNGENCEIKFRPILVQNADSLPTKSDINVDPHPGDISERGATLNCQQREVVVASCVLDSTKVVGARIAENRAAITNNTLAMNQRNVRNERSGRDPFLMFSFKPKIDVSVTPKKDLTVCNRQPSTSQISDYSGLGKTAVGMDGPDSPPRLLQLGPTEIKLSSKKSQLQLGNIPRSTIQWSKTDGNFELNRLPISMSFQDMELTSNKVPYSITRGKPVQSRSKESDQSSLPVTLRKHIVEANFTHLDQELCNYESYSTFLVRDKEMDNQMIATNSGKTSESLHLMQKDGGQQLHYPSASYVQFPVSVREQDKLMHNSSVGRFSQSSATPLPLVTKFGELNDGCQKIKRRLPAPSVHDMETLRICATVDSLEAMSGGGGPAKFSQTTHQLLITKKTGEMIRKSKVSTDSRGSALQELIGLPVGFDSHVKQGRKLQNLGHATECAGEAEVANVNTNFLCLKSESSAETDTMDIDDCEAQDAVMCPASSLPTKDFKVNKNSSKSKVMMLGERRQSFLEKVRLHHTNQEPHFPFAEESSMENRGLSTSRTESLDVEHLVYYAKQPENLNSSQQDVPLGEASNRWVKRLKLNSSDSLPCDTGSLKMGDKSSSSENMIKFGKTLNYDRVRSGPLLNKDDDKVLMEIDETLVSKRNKETFRKSLVMKEYRDQILSHPWIRRWYHNRAATTKSKPGAAVICEPQSLEASLGEFERKKLPSIAAMALMGKATSCFQPCAFRKKGSVVVWNSDGF